jgi:hypothetical protein
MLMYTVFFNHFGFMKHFDTFEEADKYAVDSGFECSIIGPDNELVKAVRVI